MMDTQTYRAYKNSPYKSIKHSTYFDVYDHLFSSYVGKDITFIEIGVLGGGSLFMWREFFGARARIIGIDLNPSAKQWEEHGFEIYIGSQSDEIFWNEVTKKVGYIDIVLDDGGHTYEQQIITVECLLPFIKNGGLLVVEDTHTSYMKGFGPKDYSFLNYAKNMIDRVHQRFSCFDCAKAENRVWGLRFFESFVVFDINRSATAIASQPTENDGKDLKIADYRHVDGSFFNRFEIWAENSSFKKIKLIYRPLRKMARLLSDKECATRLKKYFKR